MSTEVNSEHSDLDVDSNPNHNIVLESSKIHSNGIYRWMIFVGFFSTALIFTFVSLKRYQSYQLELLLSYFSYYQLPEETVGLETTIYNATIIGIDMVVVGLFGAAVFCYRANRNLRTVGFKNLRCPPVLAAVSWFLPVCNLYYPRIVMNEISKGTENPQDPDWKDAPGSILIPSWWGMGLGSVFCFGISSALYQFSPQPAIFIQAVGAGLLYGFAISFFVLTRRIDKIQYQWHRKLTAKDYESPV